MIRWPWTRKAPTSIADMPPEAQHAAVQGIRAQVTRLNKEIDESEHVSRKFTGDAHNFDDHALRSRKIAAEAQTETREKSTQRDALITTLRNMGEKV